MLVRWDLCSGALYLHGNANRIDYPVREQARSCSFNEALANEVKCCLLFILVIGKRQVVCANKTCACPCSMFLQGGKMMFCQTFCGEWGECHGITFLPGQSVQSLSKPQRECTYNPLSFSLHFDAFFIAHQIHVHQPFYFSLFLQWAGGHCTSYTINLPCTQSGRSSITTIIIIIIIINNNSKKSNRNRKTIANPSKHQHHTPAKHTEPTQSE